MLSKLNKGVIQLITNRIREIREKRGLTQIDLGDAVGVSRQTIISLEKGSYNPSLELAFKIAEVLDMTITDVFRMEEDNEIL